MARFYTQCSAVAVRNLHAATTMQTLTLSPETQPGLYACSFTEIVPISLSCASYTSTAAATADASLCSSDCYAALTPFLAACSAELNAMMAQAVSTLQPLVARCPDTTISGSGGGGRGGGTGGAGRESLGLSSPQIPAADGCTQLAQQDGYVDRIVKVCGITARETPTGAPIRVAPTSCTVRAHTAHCGRFGRRA